MAFPFEQIGTFLQWLSLTGSFGNGIALTLYVTVCTLPLIPVILHYKKRGRIAEHTALVITSLLLFLTLYYMINPHLFANTRFSYMEEMLPTLKATFAVTVWSALVCAIVFRLLRLFKTNDKSTLFDYLRKLLYMLCLLFAGIIFFSCGTMFTANLKQAQLPADRFMAIIQFAVSSLPYILDLVITVFSIRLLSALRKDRHSDLVIVLAEKLARLCNISLGILAMSGVALNILQLVLAQNLSNIAANVTIPLMSLAFVLAALLLSRLLTENKQLSDDNELFI
uniref:hypothetical protein n=1 Tax=Agathobacter sp. TaxID=2021311 RepID=UPI004057C2F2